MWPFKNIDEKVKYPCGCVCEVIKENKKLRAENEFLEKDVCKDYRIQSMYLRLSRDGEVIETLQKENLALRRKQQEIASEGYGRHLPAYGESETWHELKAKVNSQAREIETLKAILEFSEEDEKSWKDHKELYNHMIKLRHARDEEILKQEWEVKVQEYLNRLDVNKMSRTLKQYEKDDKELHSKNAKLESDNRRLRGELAELIIKYERDVVTPELVSENEN